MSLELIIGPMFSGKSTYIINQYKILHKKKKTIILNFYKDNRYEEGNYICTHNNQKEEAIKLKNLSNLDLKHLENDVFIIDEGHFFDDLLNFVLKLMKLNKKAIVIGLNGDIFGKPFTNIVSLIPYTNKLVLLSAQCSLCEDGTEGLMHITEKTSHTTKQKTNFFKVGGNEYKTVCKKHFDEHNEL